MAVPHATFPALADTGVCRHAFLLRVPGLDVRTDRVTALARLRELHATSRRALGFPDHFATAEQVHGNTVALVENGVAVHAGADALITAQTGVCLGIYVADCAPVYVVDPVRRAIGLVHSGKKGTELGITSATIGAMQRAFGTEPADLVVQVGPCIRPPDYEIDFAAEIIRQGQAAGVRRMDDCEENTAADLRRFYSYRLEMGKTGRMLALLALT